MSGRGTLRGRGDGVQVWRDSQKLAGTSWLKCPRTPVWKASIQRAQRLVNGSWLVPPEQGDSRAIILRWLPAFVAKAKRQAHETLKKWQAGLKFVTWVRTQLDELGRQAQVVLLVVAGRFDTIELWKTLPERVVMLARTGKNRARHDLRGAYAGRGTPRKYGERAPQPQAVRHKRSGWKTATLLVRGHRRKMVYRVEGPFWRRNTPQHLLFLLVVKGQSWPRGEQRRRRDPCFYRVNAVVHHGQWRLPLPVETLLFGAWQRWKLEVAHRAVTSGFGLGDKQCFNPLSAVACVQWSAGVYSLLLLAAYRTWGLTRHPRTAAKWWRGSPRWSFNPLWCALHLDCFHTTDFLPLCSTNLAKNHPLVPLLYDAMRAAAPA